MEEKDDPIEITAQYYSIHEMSFPEIVARHEMAESISSSISSVATQSGDDHQDQLEQCFQRIHITSKLSKQPLLANVGIVVIPSQI